MTPAVPLVRLVQCPQATALPLVQCVSISAPSTSHSWSLQQAVKNPKPTACDGDDDGRTTSPRLSAPARSDTGSDTFDGVERRARPRQCRGVAQHYHRFIPNTIMVFFQILVFIREHLCDGLAVDIALATTTVSNSSWKSQLQCIDIISPCTTSGP